MNGHTPSVVTFQPPTAKGKGAECFVDMREKAFTLLWFTKKIIKKYRYKYKKKIQKEKKNTLIEMVKDRRK